jgi:hypothetical protein
VAPITKTCAQAGVAARPQHRHPSGRRDQDERYRGAGVFRMQAEGAAARRSNRPLVVALNPPAPLLL